MSSTRRFQFLIFLLASLGIRLCQAFEFDLPGTVIVGIPITVGYRLKEGNPRRWKVNITDVDDRKPETLNNGEIFEAKELTGTFSVTIQRDGIFRLKAVDPSSMSKALATSFPNIAWDHPDEGPDEEKEGEDGDEVDGDEETIPTAAALASTSNPTTKSKSSSKPKSKSKPNIAVIVGAVIGVVIVLMLIICAILFFLRQRKQVQQQPTRRVTFYGDHTLKTIDEDNDDKSSIASTVTEKRRFSPKKVPPPLPIPILINPHDHPTYGGFTRDAYPGGGPVGYPVVPPRSPSLREFILTPRSPPVVSSPRLKELRILSPRPRESETIAYSKH